MNLDPTLLLDGLALGAVVALSAIAAAMVCRASAVVNFALGEFALFGAYCAWLLHLSGAHPILATPLAAALAFVLGWALDALCLRPLRARDAKWAILATILLALGLQAAYRAGFAAAGGLTPAFDFAGAPAALVALALCAALALAYLGFVARTHAGRGLRALCEHERAARALGVEPRRAISLSFALSTAIAAGGGAALALFWPIAPSQATVITALVFCAMMIAGLERASTLGLIGLALGVAFAFAGSLSSSLSGVAGHADWLALGALTAALAALRRPWEAMR